MIHPRFRLILVGVFFVSAILSFFNELGLAVSLTLLFTSFLLGIGHFKHGSVLAILIALKRGQIEKAESLLASIKRPQWLTKRYQAYYHFSHSVIASFVNDLDRSKIHAQKALELKRLPDNEEGILLYNMARVAYEKNDIESCKEHLLQFEGKKIKDLHLKKRVEELSKHVS